MKYKNRKPVPNLNPSEFAELTPQQKKPKQRDMLQNYYDLEWCKTQSPYVTMTDSVNAIVKSKMTTQEKYIAMCEIETDILLVRRKAIDIATLTICAQLLLLVTPLKENYQLQLNTLKNG